MGIIANDLTLFLISVCGPHWFNLERKMYAKQPLRTGRLHLQDAQVILGNIETNIPQYAIEY